MNFMLIDYIYLLTNFDASFFDDAKAGNCEFVFPINEQISRNNAGVFQALSKSKSRFCFSIPFQLTRDSHRFFQEETFRDIIRLLFLPNYLRLDHKVVFFMEKPIVESKGFEEFKKKFFAELRKQGINELIVEDLHREGLSQENSAEHSISLYDDNLNNLLNGTGEECFEAFVHSTAFVKNFSKKWIVPVSNADDFRTKIELSEKFENWMWQEHSFSAKLMERDRVARQDSATLKYDNAVLRFKLDTGREALERMRIEAKLTDDHQDALLAAEKKRADELLAWYHKEYEALPLWYKRFGHIVKVLSGKRKFKSLFK
jgi:hypothetical protein